MPLKHGSNYDDFYHWANLFLPHYFRIFQIKLLDEMVCSLAAVLGNSASKHFSLQEEIRVESCILFLRRSQNLRPDLRSQTFCFSWRPVSDSIVRSIRVCGHPESAGGLGSLQGRASADSKNGALNNAPLMKAHGLNVWRGLPSAGR